MSCPDDLLGRFEAGAEHAVDRAAVGRKDRAAAEGDIDLFARAPPSGDADQSSERMRAPISPPPVKRAGAQAGQHRHVLAELLRARDVDGDLAAGLLCDQLG